MSSDGSFIQRFRVFESPFGASLNELTNVIIDVEVNLHYPTLEKTPEVEMCLNLQYTFTKILTLLNLKKNVCL